MLLLQEAKCSLHGSLLLLSLLDYIHFCMKEVQGGKGGIWSVRITMGFSMADIKGETDVKLSIVSLKPGGHGAQGREDSRAPSISHLSN